MKKFEVPCYYIVDEAGKKVAAIVDIEDFNVLLEGAGAFFELVESTNAAAKKEEKKEKNEKKIVSSKVTKKTAVKKTAVKKNAIKKTAIKKR